MRYWRTSLLAALLGVNSAGLAAEASDCAALEARLASLDRASDDYWDNDFRDTEAAIDRRQAELDTAMRQARRAGCYGSTIFRPRGASSNCPALINRVDRIEAALRQEQGQRQSVANDPYSAERERSKVVGQLVAGQCGDYASYERGGRRRTGLFSALLDRRGSFDGIRIYGGESSIGFDGGTYRTLCVRSCDGYYFPISFQTTPSEFGRDEAACQAQCPAADVSLYVYRNPGEDPTQMMSMAGEPYAALPTAFLYRSRYIRACSCGALPADGYAVAPRAAAPSPLPPPSPPLVAEINGGVLSFSAAPVEEEELPTAVEAVPIDPPPTSTVDTPRDDYVPPFSMVAPEKPAATPAPRLPEPVSGPVRVVGPPSYVTVD